MMISDPIREQLRSQWQALLSGGTTRQEAIASAQSQLSSESWTDEVTHMGLQLLNDRIHETWSIADQSVRDNLLGVYERWMEDVRSFEKDPATWRRHYALNFVRRLPDRVADDFVASGDLTDGDVVEFRFRFNN